jgi:predicted amidohydrolase
MGEALATGGDTEQVLVADVTPERVAEVRAAFPFLADRG